MRLIPAVLVLVSIGLLASLLPQTSFVSRSSGGVVDLTDPIWPDQTVEQVLDNADIVSEVRIWARARFDRGEAPVVASLLRGQDEQPVRQVKVSIRASKQLDAYVLVFPPYRPGPGEELTLQLWVSTERGAERKLDYNVMFGTSEPGTGASVTIHRQPTEYGPLAHEFVWKGTGWQAALEGSTPDLVRLVGALAAAALAVAVTILSHPLVFRPLRNTARRMRLGFVSLAGRVRAVLRLPQGHRVAQASSVRTSTARRAIYVFPWLIPAFAILHYLSSNLFLFRVSESIAVFVVTMVAVTVTFTVLRLIFKTAAVAAALTGLLGIAFFSYGHIYVALGDHADDRYLLGLGVPTVLGLGALLTRHPGLTRKLGLTLNLGSVLLVLLPIYQIATDFYAGSRPQDVDPFDGFPGLEERLAEARDRLSRDQLRDIYYVILDEYPRSGSPPEFDNSEFVQQLENRGFYVAPQARSNYTRTYQSIPSSLNASYFGELAGDEEPARLQDIGTVDDHLLGRILKALGYRYVHVSSGYFSTKTNQNADLVVDFAPSGTLLSGAEAPKALEETTRLSSKFANTFLRTTAAQPFVSKDFDVEPDGIYGWGNPFRTLAWIEFMKEAAAVDGPKFIFAHLLKPHSPYSFDRFGAISTDLAGWSDDHDPTVNSAFYGQLIWLNGQLLEVIDAVLDDYDEPPIIVVAADHGRKGPFRNEILAAFLLPDGGESAVYPSITSVNHFRAILDYYFELDLGLLEDKVYSHPG